MILRPTIGQCEPSIAENACSNYHLHSISCIFTKNSSFDFGKYFSKDSAHIFSTITWHTTSTVFMTVDSPIPVISEIAVLATRIWKWGGAKFTSEINITTRGVEECCKLPKCWVEAKAWKFSILYLKVYTWKKPEIVTDFSKRKSAF